MAAISGTRSEMSGKPPSYSTQTMSIPRSSTSRELTSDPFKGRKPPPREKTSATRRHSPPKSIGSAVDHAAISSKLPPDGLRPLPNGPSLLGFRSGEKAGVAEALQNNRNVSISRQSRKDGGGGPMRVIGPVSTNASQGFGKGHVERDKASADSRLAAAGYRPPRSSSSVSISTSMRAVALGDSAAVAGFPRPVDDLRMVRKNLNSSNDNLETSPSSFDRGGVRSKVREVVTASGTPKKSSADAKGFDHVADMRGSVSSLKATHQRTGSDSSITGLEQFDANNLLQGSKSMRGSMDSKLRRKNSRENEEATCSAKVRRHHSKRYLCKSINLSIPCSIM